MNFSLPENPAGIRIHMVGIKGTGMAALAELLHSRGAILTGSDVPDTFYTDAILQALGITVMSPFSEHNIPENTELVIHSSAYKIESNVELKTAKYRGIPLLLYSEALGEFSAHSYSCGIAGVHGKTTTTGLAGTILKYLGLNASTLAGSVMPSFDNHCTMINGSKYFVAETCEYQRHFMSFHPKKIILTSIESDHQDYYPTYESILSGFMQYINLLPQFGELIYCADDPGACEAARMIFASRPDMVYTGYGEQATGDYRITGHSIKDGRQYFTLKGFTGEFSLIIPGSHNLKNATAAIALSISLLKEEKKSVTISDIGKIREALLAFSGSRRRCEVIGESKGVLIIDDYGHHPTAVLSTLAGLKEFYPNRRLIVDFMSHTQSRTDALLDDFSKSFTSADEVILHKVYASARENTDGIESGKKLFESTRKKHRNVHYFDEILDALPYLIQTLKPNDLFVTMGAGDNWKLGIEVLKKLKEKQ